MEIAWNPTEEGVTAGYIAWGKGIASFGSFLGEEPSLKSLTSCKAEAEAGLCGQKKFCCWRRRNLLPALRSRCIQGNISPCCLIKKQHRTRAEPTFHLSSPKLLALSTPGSAAREASFPQPRLFPPRTLFSLPGCPWVLRGPWQNPPALQAAGWMQAAPQPAGTCRKLLVSFPPQHFPSGG